MKNLKKVLALALTFALSLSLFAGAAFSDQATIGKDYQDDVNMLVELGVLGGYPDGSFKPEGKITRAEFTKMAYTVKYGYDDQGQLFSGAASKFTDVQGKTDLAWAKGYINYCATQNIIGGVGNNKFNPNGNVTVAEASKMLLVILGCDPIKEGFGGSNWIGNTVSKAMDLGVFDGWVGNPNEPATRQLVAKLMRNTIFAPTFVYNPITGVGSQVSPLDPSVKNETLGEKTMGLKHITGLVVANENTAINKDGEGVNIAGVSAQAKGKSQVSYEYVKTNGDTVKQLLVIDRALADSMIGNIVDVYFTADGKEGSYANVKVKGNVIVNSKTVSYDVTSSNIKIMPDGKNSSSKQVEPYIAFTVEGTEYKVAQRLNKTLVGGDDVNDKIQKVDGNKKYSGEAFARLVFNAASTPKTLARGVMTNPVYDKTANAWSKANDSEKAAADMIAQMGTDSIQKYRIISVDGGETFSYIIRFSTVATGTVASYNKETGAFSSSVVGGSKSGNEVTVKDEIVKGDRVVAYMADGKPTIEKATIVTGKATVKPGNIATIAEVDYRGDQVFLKDTINNYFRDNNVNNANTAFVVYNGYILDVDGSAVDSAITDYAVVLSSTYDASMGLARVKLAMPDQTNNENGVVYEVSKVDTSSNPNASVADFGNNAMVGHIFRYSISNGQVDLSAKQTSVNQVIANTNTYGPNAIAAQNGELLVNGQKLTANSNTVLFLLYGGNKNKDGTYTPVKAKPYKLQDEMKNTPSSAMKFSNSQTAMTDATMVDRNFASYVQSSNSVTNSMLIGAMTYGTTVPTFSPKTDTVAYLLSAKAQYNYDTSKWWLQVRMIGTDGLIAADSTETIEQGLFGSTQNADTDLVGYNTGCLVDYKLNADSKLVSIDNKNSTLAKLALPIVFNGQGTPADGRYYVNAAEISNRVFAYYPYGTAQQVNTATNKLDPTNFTLELDKDYKTIAIDDGQFIEKGGVEFVSRYDDITATQKNAIVVIEGGKVTKIFSLHNMF